MVRIQLRNGDELPHSVGFHAVPRKGELLELEAYSVGDHRQFIGMFRVVEVINRPANVTVVLAGEGSAEFGG